MRSAELARRMREAADTIAEVNTLYTFNAEFGLWNPAALRKEADVVESEETSSG